MDARDRAIALRRVRLALGTGGVLLIGAGLGADLIGPGGSAGFGRGQLLLVLLGGGLLAAAALGSRVVQAYRAAAVLLLNTALLLVVLELAAMAWFRLTGEDTAPRDARARYHVAIENVSYYAAQPWAADFWAEHWSAEQRQQYEPYVVWHGAPFHGAYVNVGETGIRATPGSTCDEGAYRVYVFGGSAVWGWGVPDDGTIPAHLRALLDARGVRGCVVNYGQNGFVSTQDLVQLVRRLQRGDVPHLALFYNGYNDVAAAAVQRRAGTHIYFDEIARRYEEADETGGAGGAFLGWVRSTRTWELASALASRTDAESVTAGATAGGTFPGLAALADSVARAYLANYRIVEALAARFGFDFAFFWQPILILGDKPRTPEERDMGRNLGPIGPLTEKVYARVAGAAATASRFHDLTAAFDEEPSLVWIDFVHLSPEGNRLIARRILERLRIDAA